MQGDNLRALSELEERIRILNAQVETLYPELVKEIAQLTGRTEQKVRGDIDYIVRTRSYAPDKHFLAEMICSFLRMQ